MVDFVTRTLPDGRRIDFERQIFNWRLCIGDAGCLAYDSTWEYQDYATGLEAFMTWDGEGEPEGWYRHPMTGRRRPDGDPAREFQRW